MTNTDQNKPATATKPAAQKTAKPAKPAATPKVAPGKAVATTGAVKGESFSIVTLKAAAISKDIGPTVLRMFTDMQKARVQAQEAAEIYAGKRYDTLALISQGIHHAVVTDKSIVLANAFSDDKKLKRRVNDQIKTALGIIEQVKLPDGSAAMRYTAAAAAVLNGMNDTAKSNFSHLLDKAAQAAQGMLDLKAEITFDKSKGTLLLSGPQVKKAFGTAKVLINEKTKQGPEGAEVELTQKPSYQMLANVAREKRGVAVGRRIDSRAGGSGALPTAGFTSVQNFENLCRNFVTTLNALEGKMTEAHKVAANSVYSALETILA